MGTCEVCGRSVREGLRFCGGQWPCWKIGLGFATPRRCMWVVRDRSRWEEDYGVIQCVRDEGHAGAHDDGCIYRSTMLHRKPTPEGWWDYRDQLDEEIERLEDCRREGRVET